jgi:peptidoglycan/LPS O-acetylase OafA/YrhL
MVRFALAMAVLLSHLPIASVKFIGGGLAVQAFFIISGFYMALVLSGKYADTSLFYTNRLLRIFPSYLVMMGLAAVIFFGFGASATATLGMFQIAYTNPVTAVVLAFENLLLIGQELLFWFKLTPDGAFLFEPTNAPPTEQTPFAWQPLLVPQAWSLSMELMFYAIAPFLARLSWRWLVAIFALSVCLRFAGQLLPVDYGLWQGRFFPTALFLFVLGMLAHRALPFAARLHKSAGWLACIGALAVVIGLPHVGIDPAAQRWIVYFTIAAAAPFAFNATKNLSVDRWIGDLSYPIYLTHLAVIGLVLTYSPPFAIWLAIGGSLVLSIALLLFVDHPVDRWRQARARAETLLTGILPRGGAVVLNKTS